MDDVFTIHRGWTLEFAEKMKQRGLRIPFECISRAERVDGEVADALVSLGCFRVWIGSDSGSQRILDRMERRVRVERVEEATRLLRGRGIEVGFFIMVGYEGEEDHDIVATLEHIRRSAPDVVLTTTAYPIHGTEYAASLADRLVNPRPWAVSSDRETLIRGSKSRRYYDAARAWIENDAESHRLRRIGRNVASIPPAVRAGWARLKMRLRAHEQVA